MSTKECHESAKSTENEEESTPVGLEKEILSLFANRDAEFTNVTVDSTEWATRISVHTHNAPNMFTSRFVTNSLSGFLLPDMLTFERITLQVNFDDQDITTVLEIY